MNRVPRLAEFLVHVTAPAAWRVEILGDLQEEFSARADTYSPHAARRWYWGQALRSILPNFTHRLEKRRRHRPSYRKGDGFMQHTLHDLKYGFRSLRKSWGFALVIVSILALGIGANTTVYSMVDGVVLHPFPFPEADELIGIGSEFPRLARDLGFVETMGPQEYIDIESQTQTLEDVIMWDMGFRSTSYGTASPEMLFSGFWFDNAFPTMRLPALHGRGFSDDELDRGDKVALVSHKFWSTHMNADPEAVGATIHVEAEPYTLIGVMPPAAQLYGMDLWIPMGVGPERFPRQARQMQILARIKPGYTLEDVNAELTAIAGGIEQEYAAEFEEYVGWRMRALTWTDVNMRQLKPAAFALLGAVGFVLLIVCANLASLLLARSAARRKEIVVRRALGASGGQILKQLLTESLMLSLMGGAAGVVLTILAVPALLSAIPLGLSVTPDIGINGRVLLFGGGVSVLVGVLFGLAPALHGVRAELQSTLNAEGKASTGSQSRHRLQRVFIGAEFALALALLVQAGLLVNSFVRLQNVDPGFDTSHTLTMRLTLPRAKYDQEGVRRFFAQLVERTQNLPGVREAGAGSQFPPITFSRGRFAVQGEQYASDDELPNAYLTLVTDGYFEALGIPLARGRTLQASDREDAPLVALVNEAAARRYWGDGEALGRRFKLGSATAEGPWIEVVGIVKSVKNRGPEVDPQPELFANIRQVIGGWNQFYLMVRTEGEPENILEAVQTQVAALDPDLPVYRVRTMESVFGAYTAGRRLGTMMLTAFAFFAVALAAAGIYAVVSYGVGERTREIGVRIALGAPQGAVRRLVMRQAMVPVLIGGVVGVIGALAAGRAASRFLFNVSGTDPMTVGAIAMLLVGSAIVASYIPARRASRLDPTVALRNE